MATLVQTKQTNTTTARICSMESESAIAADFPNALAKSFLFHTGSFRRKPRSQSEASFHSG